MHRTTPSITNTPSVSQTYRTAILSEFKGIDETVNPFSAVKNSAKSVRIYILMMKEHWLLAPGLNLYRLRLQMNDITKRLNCMMKRKNGFG